MKSLKDICQRLKTMKDVFNNSLESFGYKDIYIDVKFSFMSAENIKKYVKTNIDTPLENVTYVNDLNAYFWDDTRGYALKIHTPSIDLLSAFPNFDILGSDLIHIWTNWNTAIDCLSEFVGMDNLSNTDLFDRLKSILSNKYKTFYAQEKQQKITVLGIKKIPFEISLRRIDFHCDQDYEYDINQDYEYDLNHIERFNDEINKTLRLHGFKKQSLNISKNLRKITISTEEECDTHNIEIYSFEDYISYKTNEICRDIISCYLTDLKESRTCFLNYLVNNFFHIDSMSSDKSTFFVYREGVKFRVKTNKSVLFDNMDGHQFEYFCANVLRQNGFENVSVTSGSGDQGIDIIAYKEDIKYGIQCKCYHSDIGNKAVQEVYAGKTFYNCHVGIVLTNRDFTRSAIDLAEKDGIILWNRRKLLQMINNCKDIVVSNEYTLDL